jgi:hypothetical protein
MPDELFSNSLVTQQAIIFIGADGLQPNLPGGAGSPETYKKSDDFVRIGMSLSGQSSAKMVMNVA